MHSFRRKGGEKQVTSVTDGGVEFGKAPACNEKVHCDAEEGRKPPARRRWSTVDSFACGKTPSFLEISWQDANFCEELASRRS